MGNDERRQHPRVHFARAVRVERIAEIRTLIARDLSEGGIFLTGIDLAIGERLWVEFEAEELSGVRFRAEVEVVRRVNTAEPGVGTRFVRFEEGGPAIARLLKFLLSAPDP